MKKRSPTFFGDHLSPWVQGTTTSSDELTHTALSASTSSTVTKHEEAMQCYSLLQGVFPNLLSHLKCAGYWCIGIWMSVILWMCLILLIYPNHLNDVRNMCFFHIEPLCLACEISHRSWKPHNFLGGIGMHHLLRSLYDTLPRTRPLCRETYPKMSTYVLPWFT